MESGWVGHPTAYARPRPSPGCCCYLVQGQALLVFDPVPAPGVEAAERSAEGHGQGQVLDHLHGAGREHATDAVHLPQVPVLVQLPEQHDDVPLVEPQLSRVVPSVRVQRLGSRDLRGEKQPLSSSDAEHRQNSTKASLITGGNVEV